MTGGLPCCVQGRSGHTEGDTQMKSSSDEELDSLRPLLATLGDTHPAERLRARRKLVVVNGPAVPMLVRMLSSPVRLERWEAAKTLAEIADPRSAAALVRALEDDDHDVRWVAGEALVAVGRDALRPLLEALMERSDSLWLRKRSHYVLGGLRERHGIEEVGPVLRALEGPAPEEGVPIAAWRLLERELYAYTAQNE